MEHGVSKPKLASRNEQIFILTKIIFRRGAHKLSSKKQQAIFDLYEAVTGRYNLNHGSPNSIIVVEGKANAIKMYKGILIKLEWEQKQ